MYVGGSCIVYRVVSFAKPGSDFKKILVPGERPREDELKCWTIVGAFRTAADTWEVRSATKTTRGDKIMVENIFSWRKSLAVG